MIAPNPQSVPFTLPLAEVASARKLHCRRYAACLNLAAKACWTSFHCCDCKVDDELSLAELREQAELIRAAVVNRGRAEGDA